MSDEFSNVFTHHSSLIIHHSLTLHDMPRVQRTPAHGGVILAGMIQVGRPALPMQEDKQS
jgi:hypothetical protein